MAARKPIDSTIGTTPRTSGTLPNVIRTICAAFTITTKATIHSAGTRAEWRLSRRVQSVMALTAVKPRITGASTQTAPACRRPARDEPESTTRYTPAGTRHHAAVRTFTGASVAWRVYKTSTGNAHSPRTLIACSTSVVAGARPARRALMSAVIADISRIAPPSNRASSERRDRGHTIGTPSAVPRPDPANPTNASSVCLPSAVSISLQLSCPFGRHKPAASPAASGFRQERS